MVMYILDKCLPTLIQTLYSPLCSYNKTIISTLDVSKAYYHQKGHYYYTVRSSLIVNHDSTLRKLKPLNIALYFINHTSSWISKTPQSYLHNFIKLIILFFIEIFFRQNSILKTYLHLSTHFY